MLHLNKIKQVQITCPNLRERQSFSENVDVDDNFNDMNVL